jgi:hypothetical protein
MSRNLRGRLERLERNPPAPARALPPPGLWSWIESVYARQPFPEAEAAQCRTYWLGLLGPDWVPHRERTGDPIEERIQSLLNEPLAHERRPLPIGLRELPPEGGEK